jgi:ubiquitin-protein ligase
MTQFTCPNCQATATVTDEQPDEEEILAWLHDEAPATGTVTDGQPGEGPRCQACGTPMLALQIEAQTSTKPPALAPASPASEMPTPPRPRLPMRTRRLLADAEQMRRAFDGGALIRLQATEGEPPELYRIEYHIRGLACGPDDQPVARDTHLVEIQLTSEYPRVSPRCRVLTPIFHPNIDPSTICVGDHWAAGERLVDLVVRIGEMIAYQAYNIKSPLDGEAARWADLNQQRLPMDGRALRPAEDEGPVAPAGVYALPETAATAAPAARPPAVTAESDGAPGPAEGRAVTPAPLPRECSSPPAVGPRRWVRRLAAVAMVMGLIACALGAVVGMLKARSERDVAEQARQQEAGARAKAERERDKAVQDANAARFQAERERDEAVRDAKAARAGEHQARQSEQRAGELARQEIDKLKKQLKQDEKLLSLESLNSPKTYVRSRDGLGFITEISTELDRKDASWVVCPGLAGGDTVSFRSVNDPKQYLRHQDGRIKLHDFEDADLFKQDASFKQVNGLGKGGWVSFESVNYPGCFLRHKDEELWAERNDGSELFAKDATFRIVEPFCKR